MGQRRLPHDRDPDPDRLRAAHRGARRPLDRARARRRDRAAAMPRWPRRGAAARSSASTTSVAARPRSSSGPTPRASTATFVEGDAEALPVADASFDVVSSVFGAMFAPDQEQTASELCARRRPGGRIGLVAHTPEGFIGQLFKVIGRTRPAAGRTALADPVGHRGAAARALRRRDRPDQPRRSVTTSSGIAPPRHSSSTGGASTARRSRRSRRSARTVGRRSRPTCSSSSPGFNRADDGTMVVPNEYLEAVIVKR